MAKTASTAKKSSAKKATAKKSTKAKGASRKSDSAAKKRAATGSEAPGAKAKAGDQEITIDRRRQQRRSEEQGKEVESSQAANPPERRKKTPRRRQIDPTTCERDYSEAEVEFMNAMDEYKRTSGRMFPTCSEVLEVLRSVGYEKLTPAELGLLGRSPAEENDVKTDAATDDSDALAAC